MYRSRCTCPPNPVFFFLFISDTPFFTAYLSNKFATFVPRIIRRCRGRVTSGTNSWYCRANDIVTVTHNLHGVIARAPARPLAKNYSERLETIDDLSSPPPLPSRLLLCLRGVRVISVAHETDMNERQEPRAFSRVLTWRAREVGTAHCLAENARLCACVAHSDTRTGRYMARARAR